MMKRLIATLVLAALLTSCAAEIKLTVTDPDSGLMTEVNYASARRAVIAVTDGDITIISGQVLIDDATVQALGKDLIPLE